MFLPRGDYKRLQEKWFVTDVVISAVEIVWSMGKTNMGVRL